MKKVLVLLFTILMLAACSSGNPNPDSGNEPVDEPTAIDMSAVTSVADLKGAKIAIQTDLHEDLAKQIEDVEYSFYDSLDMSTTAVKSGIVDGAIMDEPIAFAYCNKDPELAFVKFENNSNGFKVDEADYANAAAFKKGNPLRDDVDAIIQEVGMDTFHQLMEEVLKVSAGQTIDSFCLSADPVESDEVLRVGMECASEPFNWTDIDGASFGSEIIAHGEGEGEPCNGLDVQVAKYVAAKLGRKLEVYALDWDSLLPALDAGTIDCVIGNMSPREDRKVNYDFTASYYDVNYVVLYKK